MLPYALHPVPTPNFFPSTCERRPMSNEQDEQPLQTAGSPEGFDKRSDAAFRRLAEALVADSTYTHEQAEQDLPLYVADELLRRPVSRTYPALHRHLLTCLQCAALHAAMVDDLGEQPAQVTAPTLRLDFLPAEPYLDRLKDFCLRFARPYLDSVQPRALSTLATTARVYFDLVEERLGDFGLQTAPQAAFGFPAEPSLAWRVLAATAATTYQLGHELSAERIAALRAENRLETTVQRTAMRVASDMRLGRDAGPFAIEYTRWLLQQMDDLPRT